MVGCRQSKNIEKAIKMLNFAVRLKFIYAVHQFGVL